MSSIRQICNDIDFAQGRLMQADEVALLECFRFLRTGQEIARLNRVPRQKVLKPGMANVAHPVNVNKETGKVDLLIILDDYRGAFQHPMTMFKRREAVVYVPHIPMKVLHALVAAYVLIKRVEHLTLKIVVMDLNLIEGDGTLLGDLMDREGERLTKIKAAHRDGCDPR